MATVTKLLNLNIGLRTRFALYRTPVFFRQQLSAFHSTATANEDAEKTESMSKAERTLKRFWKAVTLAELKDGYAVALDGRTLKTPSGQVLTVPKEKKILALLLAAEWESQSVLLKPHSLPLTSLVARSIDGLTDEEERKTTIDRLMNYLDTDTTCYQHVYPQSLIDLQNEHWKPLIDWVEEKYQVKLNVTNSILGTAQQPETVKRLRQEVESFDPLTLSAFERATLSSKSFIIALALVKRQLSVEAATTASRVEVLSQIKQWGMVEDTHDVDLEEMRRQLGSVACSQMS
ncbi:ATP12-domain-containing protein [Basidiobolus meristosporus CBS 931.73]|uniref:ATP12-domain-containing protein n=1 Tax=Basidiobolus meristosporus CBS 931.73 TaxID=1314790 RepID=A0A1Y1Y0H4_9FUNG|nr:ATP12-domain-containing protein [Basidiobolus meristosporus CBS 931.73]|eukprot:ORX91500.1 ATP12-domain-containing protein [Basidiobolus meristosporus CBS 931.73]